MPAAIPAVVTWATTAFSSAVTATAVGLGKLGLVAAIGEGATIALAGAVVKTAAVTGLSLAAGALFRPSVPSTGTTLDFKPDPKAPIAGMMGYAATGGNKVFQGTWGYKGVALSMGIALSLGPIDAITRFTADDAVVTFAGPESEAVGYFDDDMWLKTTLGTPTDPHLTPPTSPRYGSPPLTGWDSTHRALGTSFAFWTLLVAKNEEDRDIFTQGVPDPRFTGRWMKVYDWRRDSTQAGGSGAQRENDWRTWAWSENPYVHARAWLRGHFKLNENGTLDYTKRIAGVGIPPSAIDQAAFTEGANVADANGWVISGGWSTTDDKWQVLAAMLQSGGGRPINRGAQVSVLVNMPRVSTYTYTRDDMIGQAEVKPMTRRRERKNTIVPRYRSEVHSWEYVAAGEVTSTVYRTEDKGEPRSIEKEYTYVRLAKQAAELAAYDLVNVREGLSVTLPSKVHLMHIHAGDCITINVPEMALASQKVIVMRTLTDYKNATVTLECQSETEGKHAFALGQAANPPPSPTLSRIDPYFIPAPIGDEWNVEVKNPVDGVGQPILIVEGNPGTSDVASVVIEYALSATGPWLSAGPADVASGRYQINGLDPMTPYWVSVRYVSNNGAISERYIEGPRTTGNLVSGDTVSLNGEAVQEVLDRVNDANEAIFTATTGLQDRTNALWTNVNAPTTGINARLNVVETNLTSLTTSTSSRLNTLEATINTPGVGIAARVGQLETATSDLQFSKADASVVNSIIAEISDARNGKATLNAELSSIRQATADGLALKASAEEVSLISSTVTVLNNDRLSTALGGAPAVNPDNFTNALVGPPSSVPNLQAGWTAQNNPNEGMVYRLAGIARHVCTKGWVPIGVGRTHRVTARVRVSSDGANANRTGVGFRLSNEASLNGNGIIAYTNQSAASGWQTLVLERTSEQLQVTSAASTHFRVNAFLGVISTGTTASGATVELAWLRYDDVTDTATLTAKIGNVTGTVADALNGKASASSVTALEATINTPGTGVTSRLTTVESVAASADGTARAIQGVTLDVNGYISGHGSINDGNTADFFILADRFALLDPSGGDGTEYRQGNWFVTDSASSARTRYGRAFGGAQGLVWWTGPSSVPEGSETKSNAYVYISMNTTGGSRFGGSDVPSGGGFTAKISRAFVVGSRSGAGTVTTPTTTIQISGTSDPVTYRWWYVSGDASLVRGGTSDNEANWQTTLTAMQSKRATWGWSAATASESQSGLVEIVAQAF